MSISKTRLGLIFSVILMVCAISWVLWHSGNREIESPGGRQNGLRQAPQFNIRDHAGVFHTLQEARGKIVIVHFWAAWCPPCLQEIPELLTFAEHLQGERFQLIAISLDDKWEDAEKVLSTPKLPKDMVSLLDGGAKISDAYGTYQFPESYLINADGNIITKWVGAQAWSNPQSEKLIRGEISRIPSSNSHP